MANLPEQAQWEDGIYQLETSDPVLAGPDGIDNRQATQLGNRTAFLKKKVEDINEVLVQQAEEANPFDQYMLREAVAAQVGPLSWLGTATGTANALSLALPAGSKVDAYQGGQRFRFKAAVANTAAVTAKIGTLAAKSIFKSGSAGLVELDAGDLQPGVVYVLTFDGQQFQLGSGVSSSTASLPVGSVVAFFTDVAPPGFLEANGSRKDAALYPALFAHLGTKYNQAGDPVGTFRLPDTRAEFLRGLDNGRDIDPGRVIGSSQLGTAVAFDDATGFGVAGWRANTVADDNKPENFGADRALRSDYPNGNTQLVTSATSVLATVGTARPRNVAVMWCIKAWGVVANEANIDVAALASKIERNRVKRISRVTSAVVQALTGTALGPVAFSPLTTPFQADGGIYRITARLQMNMSSAGVAGSNYISATLMDGATVLDRVSFNIVETTWTGFSATLEWSGPLNGSVNLSVAFEKSFAAASVNVNGDRDNTTSNDSGQLSYLEILRLGDA